MHAGNYMVSYRHHHAYRIHCIMSHISLSSNFDTVSSEAYLTKQLAQKPVCPSADHSCAHLASLPRLTPASLAALTRC